ncbi:MAG TPA: metallophosphoesterase, partial [Candidatus Saccharimonadales bacterium]|nr:metallophosphoesterase [Candidatus Saccharimonadales bacterium]
PHKATVRIISEQELQVDLGPLGELSTKSPLPVFGVKAVIKEVPDGNGAEAGQDEIKQYTQLFSEPERQAMQANATSALIRRGITYGVLGVGTTVGGAWLLGSRGRGLAKELSQSKRVQAAAGVVLSMALLTGSAQSEHTSGFHQDAFLASIGLPGVKMKGKLLEIVASKFGPDTINYIHELDDYYKVIEKNLDVAYAAKLEEEKRTPSIITQQIEEGNVDQALWISDNHCNTETASIAAEMANKIDAVFVLDSGDQTMGGTAAERPCAAALPNKLHDGIPIVVSLGNHDSRDVTAKMDKELGYTVLESKPVDVKGYRFLGDSDVNRSEFNVEFHQVGPESSEEQAARLAQIAQEDGAIDIAMTHEPETGDDIAKSETAKLVLSGHTHTFRAPKTTVSPDGSRVTYQMVNGTTGGAAPNKMTFESKLGKKATMVVLYFNNETHDPVGYRKIELHTDQQVVVGDIVPFAPMSLPPHGVPVE